MNITALAKKISDIIHWLRNAEIETVQKIHDLLNPALDIQTASITPTEAATIAAAQPPPASTTIETTDAPSATATAGDATNAGDQQAAQ